MSKYTQKIVSYLSDTDPIINLGDNLINNVSISNIYTAASKSHNDRDNNSITTKSSKTFKKIHSSDEFPLMYIFFKKLYECKLLDDITPFPPDVSDLHTFIQWYRENSNAIKYDAIHMLMDNIDNTNPDDSQELVTLYTLIYKTEKPRTLLHDAIYKNSFVTVDIQFDLEISDLSYTEYYINDKHTIHFFYPITGLINTTDERYINIEQEKTSIVRQIIYIINTFENLIKIYRPDIEPSPVNLTVLYSNQKKNIHPEIKIICPDNVNSGSTYPGMSIVCWRKEEFYKVLIHELVHYHDFDYHVRKNDNQSRKGNRNDIRQNILVPNIDGIDKINESYTESLAIIILTIMRYVTSPKILSFDVFFINTLKTEIAFTLFQVSKVLTIFGCDNFSDYSGNKCIIKQSTSYRSYFIIKLLLLTNFDELIKLINKNMIIVNYTYTDFVNLINASWESFLQNNNNINIINKFIKQIKNIYAKHDMNNSDVTYELDWIHKTCRMSVFDL